MLLLMKRMIVIELRWVKMGASAQLEYRNSDAEWADWKVVPIVNEDEISLYHETIHNIVGPI